jgi:hypothetical protein
MNIIIKRKKDASGFSWLSTPLCSMSFPLDEDTFVVPEGAFVYLKDHFDIVSISVTKDVAVNVKGT